MNFSQDYSRSVDDVKSIVKYAKLDHKNLTNVAQAIYYPATEETPLENIKLLEVDAHILSQIKEGQTISFKGALNEKVVLCTETKTYEVKEAEISNSLLLVPALKLAQATSASPIKSPKGGINTSLDSSTEDVEDEIENVRTVEKKEVIKIFHDYYECREVKPKLRKIVDLLKLTRYSGSENEHLIERQPLFRFNQLLDTVQCSKAEFQGGLKQYRAIEIDGRLRMLENEYEYRVISLMISLIAENSWKLDEVDKAETINALDAIVPYEIVDGLFDIYTDPNEALEGKFQYKPNMICGLFAEKILQQGLKFHIDDFLSTWQGTLPDGFTIDEKYIRGIGIIDRESAVPCVRELYEPNLSTNLLDRLTVLFKTKERWNLEQIEPYIEYFTTPQLGVTAILAKHTRSLVVNGVRIYVSKH